MHFKITLALLTIPSLIMAAPLRVAVLDGIDETSGRPDGSKYIETPADSFAKKAYYLLASELTADPGMSVIDRRDLLGQVQKSEKAGVVGAASVIRAAQMLNADMIVKPVLLVFAASKELIDIDKQATENVKLQMRISIQAISPVDGSVIAMAEGSAINSFRQTDSVKRTIGDAEAAQMMEESMKIAVPVLLHKIKANQAAIAQKPVKKLTITTDSEPALVEIDGLLVGSSPLKDYEIYEGDHAITVSKPGYRTLAKKINITKTVSIQVTMLRTVLSADEIKELASKAKINIYSGIEPALIMKETE